MNTNRPDHLQMRNPFCLELLFRIFPLSADREILNLYLSCVGNLFSQLGTKKEREAGKWSEDYAGRPILKWCGIVRGMCVISVL